MRKQKTNQNKRQKQVKRLYTLYAMYRQNNDTVMQNRIADMVRDYEG